jgi:hypothetical protein
MPSGVGSDCRTADIGSDDLGRERRARRLIDTTPWIHLLVSRCSSKSFNEYVVSPAALSVHADFDFVVIQHLNEREGCKLTPLIRIHSSWYTVCIVFENFKAKILWLCQFITATMYRKPLRLGRCSISMIQT